MLRGDDVADLQQRLCTLGFDTGRVDGIFGDATARALGEFQRNAGLPVDGIVGGATLRELLRLESRHHDPELVSAVRARAALRDAPPPCRAATSRSARAAGSGSVDRGPAPPPDLAGTRVTELHHPDDADAGQGGQRAGGRRLRRPAAQSLDSSGCRTAFWSGTHDESPGGRRLAEMVQRCVPGALGVADGGAPGMSVPILRETRMPAVVVEIGPAQPSSSSRHRRWPPPSSRRSARWADAVLVITSNHALVGITASRLKGHARRQRSAAARACRKCDGYAIKASSR